MTTKAFFPGVPAVGPSPMDLKRESIRLQSVVVQEGKLSDYSPIQSEDKDLVQICIFDAQVLSSHNNSFFFSDPEKDWDHMILNEFRGEFTVRSRDEESAQKLAEFLFNHTDFFVQRFQEEQPSLGFRSPFDSLVPQSLRDHMVVSQTVKRGHFYEVKAAFAVRLFQLSISKRKDKPEDMQWFLQWRGEEVESLPDCLRPTAKTGPALWEELKRLENGSTETELEMRVWCDVSTIKKTPRILSPNDPIPPGYTDFLRQNYENWGPQTFGAVGADSEGPQGEEVELKGLPDGIARAMPSPETVARFGPSQVLPRHLVVYHLFEELFDADDRVDEFRFPAQTHPYTNVEQVAEGSIIGFGVFGGKLTLEGDREHSQKIEALLAQLMNAMKFSLTQSCYVKVDLPVSHLWVKQEESDGPTAVWSGKWGISIPSPLISSPQRSFSFGSRFDTSSSHRLPSILQSDSKDRQTKLDQALALAKNLHLRCTWETWADVSVSTPVQNG